MCFFGPRYRAEFRVVGIGPVTVGKGFYKGSLKGSGILKGFYKGSIGAEAE